MNFLDFTSSTPEENLAVDEWLLDQCERGLTGETLRLWEASERFAVLGYGGTLAQEVNAEACRRLSIPIRRRFSGGGTVLQAPGCLNFTLLLHHERGEGLLDATGAARRALERMAEAFSALAGGTAVEGYGDITLGGKKFSGSAQRAGRHFLLLHGTILLTIDLPAMEAVLPLPLRVPKYRRGRAHADFLTHFPAAAGAVRAALRELWQANRMLTAPAPSELAPLSERYRSQDFICRR
jgi:lipoate---protein ligase